MDFQKTNLVGLDKETISKLIDPFCESEQVKNMRVSQLWDWIYIKGETDFNRMTNISKSFRNTLIDNFFLERLEIKKRLISKDGTRKYLLALDDGNLIETVYIPEKDRGTLCISSQVGCTLNCSFCFTGTQRLVRNLSGPEIVQQIMILRDELKEWEKLRSSKDKRRSISNIVLMGMGEPLYNFDEVKKGLKIIMDETGISISRKRITLSTSGVVPKIGLVGEEIGCLLAISFHATTDEIRNELVPLNKKWNIDCLLTALRNYPGLSNSERITFEYVMMKGFNDTLEDAHRLMDLLEGIKSKVNLIPYNENPNREILRPDHKRVKEFQHYLVSRGRQCTIRTTRGIDISAACGQLGKGEKQQRVRISRIPTAPSIDVEVLDKI